MNARLSCGDWREVLADIDEVDTLVADPPYGARTHDGHNRILHSHDGERILDRATLDYAHWSAEDVAAFVAHWSPRTRGWFVALTSHDLWPAYERALLDAGRYVFHPIPCVIRGMTVRLCGDGPASWAVWAVVARPKSKAFASWGSLPGAYVTTRGGRDAQYVGGKPLSLMSAIVRDYSRPGDLVCDPCAGMATTGVAAEQLGRRFVGAEIDETTCERARARLAGVTQLDLLSTLARP